MDTLVGVIVEMILEGFFGVTIRNPELKIWTKTIVSLVISAVIPVLMVISGVSAIGRGNVDGGVPILVMAAVLETIFVLGTIYNHKRGWKQTED